MEYNEYGDYDLDENIEIEDFEESEDFSSLSVINPASLPIYEESLTKDQDLKTYYEDKAIKDNLKIQELETKYMDILNKYKSLTEEYSKLKKKNPASERDTIKQLEERVLLIKEKAKEKLVEKEEHIDELNKKISNYDEILKVMEVNCKQAVVKFSEFQQEIAKKDEQLQEHFNFKNRYDYTINYLTEKCQKLTDTYERRITVMENKLESVKIRQNTELSGPGDQSRSLTEAIEELDSSMQTRNC